MADTKRKRKKSTAPRNQGLLQEIPRPRARTEPHAYSYDAGERIGAELTVIGHLAAGRWSELYQVWSSTGWCPLTCKMLSKQHAANRKALAALRREQKILRKVHHPSIVRIFGEGQHEGSFYLVLEYLEGPTALDALESRPNRQMAVSDAVRLAIQAGAGVGHLHRLGFLHLDIKPANLLLRGGIPVLLDLDTARKVYPLRSPRERLGTGPYMSPEQALRLPLGAAADVYGLGATLYELVTGRWPFENTFDKEKGKKFGLEARYPQIGEGPPPSCRSLRPEVSKSLDEAIQKSIARDPMDRFQSIHEFLEILSRGLKETESLWPKKTRPTNRI